MHEVGIVSHQNILDTFSQKSRDTLELSSSWYTKPLTLKIRGIFALALLLADLKSCTLLIDQRVASNS